MEYKLTTYQEGYIEQQFEIGSSIYDKWRMGGQTRIPQLKDAYSKDNFDPETRFYAFYEDKMVAFMTASLIKDEGSERRAYFEFPFILPGHEHVLDRLIEFSFTKLRERGFSSIVTRAGPYWGKTLELTKQYRFQHDKPIVNGGEIHLDSVDVSKLEKITDIFPYDIEKDIDQLAKIFAEKFSVDIDVMKKNLLRFKDLKVGDTIKNPWDQNLTLVSNVVGRVNGEVVARGVAMNNESYGTKNVNVMTFYVKEGLESIKQQLFSQIVRDCKKQDYHRIIAHTGLWGLHPDNEYFEEFGFKFTEKLGYYSKELLFGKFYEA